MGRIAFWILRRGARVWVVQCAILGLLVQIQKGEPRMPTWVRYSGRFTLACSWPVFCKWHGWGHHRSRSTWSAHSRAIGLDEPAFPRAETIGVLPFPGSNAGKSPEKAGCLPLSGRRSAVQAGREIPAAELGTNFLNAALQPGLQHSPKADYARKGQASNVKG